MLRWWLGCSVLVALLLAWAYPWPAALTCVAANGLLLVCWRGLRGKKLTFLIVMVAITITTVVALLLGMWLRQRWPIYREAVIITRQDLARLLNEALAQQLQAMSASEAALDAADTVPPAPAIEQVSVGQITDRWFICEATWNTPARATLTNGDELLLRVSGNDQDARFVVSSVSINRAWEDIHGIAAAQDQHELLHAIDATSAETVAAVLSAAQALAAGSASPPAGPAADMSARSQTATGKGPPINRRSALQTTPAQATAVVADTLPMPSDRWSLAAGNHARPDAETAARPSSSPKATGLQMGPGSPNWACEYGNDRIGTWCILEVDGARQRFCRLPPREADMPTDRQVPLWMADTECTQGLWSAVMRQNPSRYGGRPDAPVEHVSWNDVQAFLDQLRHRFGSGFRLPRHAEWRWACHAGSGAGQDPSPWHVGNASRPQPVATRPANAWGLYDMLGNVWEWCEDAVGSADAPRRIFCGGGWSSPLQHCSPDSRRDQPQDARGSALGFRIVWSAAP